MTDKEKLLIKQIWQRCHWLLSGLILLALILSVILSWHHFTGESMAGCGGGSPCEQVLGSRWSMLAGIIPVSGLAIGIYMALFVTLFFSGFGTEITTKRLAWKVLLVFAGSIAGSAIWFTIIQKRIIGDFCNYCMTAHVIGLLIAALIVWKAVKVAKMRIIQPATIPVFLLFGFGFAGILAISQVTFNPSTENSNNNDQVKLSEINYKKAPLVGSSDATYIVNLLFDYQCPHCQRIHFLLEEATRRYNNKLAFALCPVPLNNQCNQYIPPEADAYKNSCELTRISLAVWLANRELFTEFENWMFTFESGRRWTPRNPDAAKAKAIELVGLENFEKVNSDPWIDEYIQTCVQIYGQTILTGKRGVPKMVYNSNWIMPEPYNVEELIAILQNNFSIQ
ncbi:MAG: hypothetical protein JXR61_02560 [Prolixibacteraceae bacterium]|nr:hypothetical protein [Prolixibacteraceae bacterium]